MHQPLAYLLTWTCYGTWLHGDKRGSVAPGHNAPGTEFLPENAWRCAFEKGRMPSGVVELDSTMRSVIARAMDEHAQAVGWKILARSVRTNHAHVVIAAPDMPPEPVMTSLKAWATRQLREARLVPAGARLWTRHGSTRYLWDERSVTAAVRYVVETQDAPRGP